MLQIVEFPAVSRVAAAPTYVSYLIIIIIIIMFFY